jgi:hypothetical protein
MTAMSSQRDIARVNMGRLKVIRFSPELNRLSVFKAIVAQNAARDLNYFPHM